MYKSSMRMALYEEFANWLSRNEVYAKKLEKLRKCMKNNQPRTLLYNEAFPRTPANVVSEHQFLAEEIGSCDKMDLVSSTIMFLVILL